MNVKNMIGKAPGATAPKFFSFIILFILTASLFNINAQDVIEKWVTIFGSNQSDYAADITANDSGIYVTGREDLSADGFLTAKLNAEGQEQWIEHFSLGVGDSKVYAIASDNSGNVYVAGRSNVAMDDYVAIKYNNDGVKQWHKAYNRGASNDWVADIAVDDSGNVFLTGYSWGASFNDMATVKFNSEGTQQWDAVFNGAADGYDAANAIAVDDSGNVYVTGYSNNGTDADYATIKYNSAGVEQWSAFYNNDGNNNALDIAVDDSGNVYVTGKSSNGTNDDYTTVKYNSSGVEQWVAIFNGTADNTDEVKAIAIDTSGNVYVSGISSNGTDNDYATVKYNSSGVEQWVAVYNGIGEAEDKAYDMVVDPSGNVYVNGVSHNGTSWDYATIKYNTDGVQQWVGLYKGSTYESRIDMDPSGNIYTMGSTYDYGWQYLVIGYCDDIPVATVSNDTAICAGETVYLSAGGGDTYTWSPAVGLSDTTISNPEATPTVTTTYQVIVSNACTSDTAYVTITVNTYYMSDPVVEICGGDSAIIYGEYRTESGTYHDNYIAVNGCDSIHSTELIVHPTYYIEVADTICPGESIMAGGELQTESGIYYDSLLTVKGCDSIIVTDLWVRSLVNADIGPDTLWLCDGENLTFDIVDASSENVESYLIGNYFTTVYDTELNFDYLIANPAYAVYSEATGIDGCVYSDRVVLRDNSIYNMYQQYPSTDDPWVTFQIGSMPDNVDLYYWRFGDGDSLIGDPNPTHIYKENGTFNACLVGITECETDSSCYYVYIYSSGLEELSQANHLSIYPNPSNDVVKIEVNNPSNEEIFIEIMNMRGQIIYSEKRWSSFVKEIDLTKSGKGIYLIKAQTDSTIQVERVIIE